MDVQRLFFFSHRRKNFFYIAICFLVQSCSGSEVGKRLADSFEKPLDPVSSSNRVQANQSKQLLSDNKEKDSNLIEKRKKSSTSLQKKKSFSEVNNQSKLVAKEAILFTPASYRIIIRLPSVNPSAPAETVTKALRNAGVIFEVEKIERFDKKSLFKSSSSR